MESELTKKFCDATGAYILVLSASLRQTNGIPDRYVSSVYWNGFVEFKWDKGQLRTDQRIVISKLLERGTLVAIIRFHRDGSVVSERLDGSVIASAETLSSVSANRLLTETKVYWETAWQSAISCSAAQAGKRAGGHTCKKA